MRTGQAIGRDVFVISDLHIGGRYGTKPKDRGFRINTHINELARFVNAVEERAHRTGRCTELVINGDFIDFLAEETQGVQRWHAFMSDGDQAVEAFDAIMSRDKIVFDALRSALQAGVCLTILLGNHDVELSLPALRVRLFDALTNSTAGRCRFLYDGEAHVIGDVVIEHGNRYDPFNAIDHDCLRRHRSARSRRHPLGSDVAFRPPPGSHMVEQVMNPIKENYAFIDLLKPETETVVPLLLALEPGFARDIERIWNLYERSRQAKEHTTSMSVRPLGPGDIRAECTAAREPGGLRKLFIGQMGDAELNRLMALVKGIETERMTGRPIDIQGQAQQARSLLKLSSSQSREKRVRVLLDSFRCLQNDTSFDRSVESDKYLTHAKNLAAAGFRVVIFGHTHLAKDLPLDHGATYLNTGTWADLMRVPSEILSASDDCASEHLERFVDAMQTGDLQAYVEFMPTFAHIQLDQEGRTVSAKLREFNAEALSEL
jgi:UDP-2,3-diacylglucosamine pyrophosphatase LpxH